jgi:hypothetical protein
VSKLTPTSPPELTLLRPSQSCPQIRPATNCRWVRISSLGNPPLKCNLLYADAQSAGLIRHLSESEERQESDDDDNGANNIDDAVHEHFLRVMGFKSRARQQGMPHLSMIL